MPPRYEFQCRSPSSWADVLDSAFFTMPIGHLVARPLAACCPSIPDYRGAHPSFDSLRPGPLGPFLIGAGSRSPNLVAMEP